MNLWWIIIIISHFTESFNHLCIFFIFFLRRSWEGGMSVIRWQPSAHGHDDAIKWKHFPPYWPFVCGIHRSPVNSLHQDQWCRVLVFSLFCAWTNCVVNNRDAGVMIKTHCDGARINVMVPVVFSYSTGIQSSPVNREKVESKMILVCQFTEADN